MIVTQRHGGVHQDQNRKHASKTERQQVRAELAAARFEREEELAGWPYDEDDNPPQITEADIDWVAEVCEADELAEHNRREAEDLFRPFERKRDRRA